MTLVRPEYSTLTPYLYRKQTAGAYTRDFERFARWCGKARRRALPASPHTIVLFLCHLAKNSQLRNPRPLLTAVNRAHDWNGFAPPARDVFLVQQYVKAYQKRMARHLPPSRQWACIAAKQLVTMLWSCPPVTADWQHLRDVVALSLAYLCALRARSLFELTRGDVRIAGNTLHIRIRHTKFGDQRASIQPLRRQVECARSPTMQHLLQLLMCWLQHNHGASPQTRCFYPDASGNARGTASNAMTLSLRRALTRIEAPPMMGRVSSHIIRRALTNDSIIAGVAAARVQAWGDWSSQSAFQKYLDTRTKLTPHITHLTPFSELVLQPLPE